ncbi:hypothetical protein GCM10007939_02460 [Amylibacter marinus]|uniref:HTH luxR-type domain-containing protein n=2 Tax=Amylibacter marinus TaxID=1475483 RepID=A0ABQ5VRX0_9RHOB|nr:hypothetical protein GCM10007939_02460 [Amylibacter marinus]
MLINRFIQKLTQSNDVATNWAILLDALASFGFDRVLYGKKLNFSPETLHNHSGSVLLSSYGEKLDQEFLLSRLYLHSPTLQWAMYNYGCISWGETKRRADAGKLTPEQMDAYEKGRQCGLNAGVTYSVPTHTRRYRSAFGMAFRADGTQEDADETWKNNESDLTALLCIFDLTIAQFENIPSGQKLDTRTIHFMKLIAEGRTVSEISEIEGCHHRTIDQRMANARDILGANNTLHAVLLAKEQGQF